MVDKVHLRYRRVFPFPLDVAYAWLTDYDDRDAERAGAVIQDRRVAERGEHQVRLDATVDVLGSRWNGQAIVDLHPPDHWVANIVDHKGRDSGTYEYRLTPRGEHESLLTVDYHFAVPKLKHKVRYWFTRPFVRRRLDQMWDGFERAMVKELRGPNAADPVAAAP